MEVLRDSCSFKVTQLVCDKIEAPNLAFFENLIWKFQAVYILIQQNTTSAIKKKLKGDICNSVTIKKKRKKVGGLTRKKVA